MTLPAQTAHVEYTGNGTTGPFTYDWRIDTAGELEVRVDSTLKVRDVHYTLTGVGNPNGGNVTFIAGFEPASNTVVAIRRIVDFDQLLDLVPNSALPAESVEARLDQLTKMMALINEEMGRTPTLREGVRAAMRDMELPHPDSLDTVAGGKKYLSWNDAETNLTLREIADSDDAVGLLNSTVETSTFGGLPAAGTAGRVKHVTDSPEGLFVDTGSAWRHSSDFPTTALGSIGAAGTAGRVRKVTNDGRGTYVDTGFGWAHLEQGMIDIREWTISGTDITSALQSAVNEARANKMGVYIPPGEWDITTTIFLGVGDSSSATLMPHLVTGVSPGNFSGGARTTIEGDFDGPLFSIDSSDFANPTGQGRLENLRLINHNIGNDAGCLYVRNTSQVHFRGLECYATSRPLTMQGENIFFRYEYGAVTGDTGPGSEVAPFGLQIAARNAKFIHVQIFGCHVGIGGGGDSLYFEACDVEFCDVAIQTTAATDYVFNCCHFETVHCLLTNYNGTPPFSPTAWVDPGGSGTGIAGGVHFYGCTVHLYPTMLSNLFVIKSSASFIYPVYVIGGSWAGDQLRASDSFAPGSTVPPADGCMFIHFSSGNIDYQVPTTHGFTNVVQVQPGSSAFRVQKYNKIDLVEATGSYGMDTSGTAVRVKGFGGVQLRQTSSDKGVIWTSQNFYPETNNDADLGVVGTNEWRDLYIVNAPSISSDLSEKEDVIDEPLGLGFINKLRPIQYRQKGRNRPHHSLPAQQVKAVLDELGVDHAGYVLAVDEHGNSHHRLRPTEFIGNLIKSVQELYEWGQQLSKRVEELEGLLS